MRTRDDRGRPVRVREPGSIRLQSREELRHPHRWESRVVFVRWKRKEPKLSVVAEVVGLWLAAALFLVPGLIRFTEERNGIHLLLILVGGMIGFFGAMRPRMLTREREALR